MSERNNILDHVRVASPCAESWDEMAGDNEVRWCSHCRRSVHNLTQLTRSQAESLVARSQGRLCVRYESRRDDSSMLFKERGFSVRGVGRRASLAAGAALAAFLGLSTSAGAQQKDTYQSKACSDGSQVSIKRAPSFPASRTKLSTITGTLIDPHGAVIQGAVIKLFGKDDKKIVAASTTDEGGYKLSSLEAGIYTVTVEAFGFKKISVEKLIVGEGEDVRVDVTMPVETVTVTVGIISISDPLPNPSNNLVIPIDKAPLIGLSGRPDEE